MYTLYSVQRLVHGIALNVLDVLLGWLHTLFFRMCSRTAMISACGVCVCVCVLLLQRLLLHFMLLHSKFKSQFGWSKTVMCSVHPTNQWVLARMHPLAESKSKWHFYYWWEWSGVDDRFGRRTSRASIVTHCRETRQVNMQGISA